MQKIDRSINIMRQSSKGITKGIVLFAVVLFLFLMAPVASAVELVCTDCHKTSPHAATGCNSSDCVSCHTGKMETVTHPRNAGTPLDFDLLTDAGRTAACKTCHTATGHPVVGVGVDSDAVCGVCHGGSGGATVAAKGAPYLTVANLQVYAQVMHGGVPIDNGLDPVAPVLPPGPGCDSALMASGTLTGGECLTDSSLLTTCTTTLGSATTLTGPFSNQVGNTHIYWGDGTAIETNPTSPADHTYSSIGRYQISQTVTNPCGYRSQKHHIVNVTGGTTGKGTLKIDVAGADGRKVSYKVIAGSGVNVTNGSIVLDGSKSIILDPGTYTLEILYSSVVPLTDPVQYHSCGALAGSSNILDSRGLAVIGQRVSVTVTQNVTTTISLTNCD